MIPPDVISILEPLVRRFEGCKLEAYLDPAGIWTIGWGHTPAQQHQVCTQDQANSWLADDLSHAYNQLLSTSPSVSKTSGTRQAALSDFVYNMGIGRYTHSTLRSAVDCGAWGSVKMQLALWIHAGGKVAPGLVDRRDAEIALIDRA